MPSLKATPVSAANMGPTSHVAPGWSSTNAGTDAYSGWVAAMPTEPRSPRA